MRLSRFFGCAVACALSISTLSATPATAVVPDEPQLISPADASVTSAADIPLSVRASDPDGGSVQVTFEGRRVGATVPAPEVADPFTIVALPDVQNYTYSNRQGIIRQQAEWVISTRSQLNTAMVVQLGDLVSEDELQHHWRNASDGLKVLDDAGVPNTVIAGNHDFNVTTGTFTEYDQYFPPSRYADASWTPATARYGGYMGQDLFGPDPVDRRNMNNFALFSAGGRDFLVLNLEWEAPRYALDWAAKILAAYPDRLAIMTTHSFLGLNGLRRTKPQRVGGTSAEKMWTDFVSQQCSIKLVLNGHFSNGDAGEASRSDANRCGQPVQQILTNYQSRPNGGDGWLRYYTFDPAANTMTARTYSPKLGTFESDADSAFTVPFSLTGTQPAPFIPIDQDTVTSGEVAQGTWTGLDPDTLYEWRATSSDGQTTTVSPTWTVKTPLSTQVVEDTFTRNVTNGWGATAAGQIWKSTSTAAAAYAVDGSVGRIVAPVGYTRGVRLPSISITDAAIQTDLSLSPVASGSGTYVSVQGRINGSASYQANVRYLANGRVNLSLIRRAGSGLTLASTTLPGPNVTAGQYLRLKFELAGSSPTRLRAKLWPRDQSEPASWTVTATDTTAALQSAGELGIDVYPSGSATNPATVTFDRYVVTRLGATPPPTNKPPTATIDTPTIDERTIMVAGSSSTDDDGTITDYSWDFGDTHTATGSTATHTYDSDDTYTLRLTVTDDDGDTHTATRELTVTASTPPTTEIAADAFERNVINGWGAAPTGGSWTALGSAGRYSVTDGAGNYLLATPGRSAESILTAVSARDIDLRTTLAWSRSASAGALYGTVFARRQANGSDYRLTVYTATSGAMRLIVKRKIGTAETTLRTVGVPDIVLAADEQYRVAFRATTRGTTTDLAAKLWRAGAPEPASWAAVATDDTAQLAREGSIGFNSYLSRSSGIGVTVKVDDLVVVDSD